MNKKTLKIFFSYLKNNSIKVAPYSYNVSVHVLFESLLFLFRESCGVET